MSTFTDWNGPQGSSNIRAIDLIELTKAYRDLVAKFEDYQRKLIFDTEPIPGSNNSLTSGVIKQALNEVEAKLNNYYTKQAIEDTYAPKTLLNDKVTKPELQSALLDYAKTEAMNTRLREYLKTSALSEQDIIVAIKSDIDIIYATLAEDIIEKKELHADTILGCIHALEEIQFQDKAVSAYIGGSHGMGVYYILGMVDTDRAGTAYVKYQNDKPFSAVVNWSVTKDEKGALNVLTDNRDLANLKFLLVAGTDKDGEKHVYLAIQSEEWIPTFVSTDGKGMFSLIDFEVAGINLAPTKSEHFVQNNAECVVIAECTGDFGFNVSDMTIANAHVEQLSTDKYLDAHGNRIAEVVRKPADEDTPETKVLILGDVEHDSISFAKRPTMSVKIEGEEDPIESPLLNQNDIKNISVPIGAIIRWDVFHTVREPVLDENGNPIINEGGYPNPLQEDGEEAWYDRIVLDLVPDGWAACSGEPFDTSKYTILASLYPDGKLPLEDFSIIKITELVDDTGTDVDPSALLTHKYLDKKITLEIQRSKEEDAKHDQQIYDEGVARAEADNGLSERITQNREGIIDLDTRLNAEATARAEADNGLSERITQNREGIIDHDARINQNKAGIRDLDTRLNAEKDARIAADQNLDQKITDEETARIAGDTVLDQKIIDEQTRAENAEQALDQKIDDEQARAENAESTISSILGDKIDQEVLDREAGDNDLQALLKQLNKQSVQIYTGTVADLPTQTPVPVTGAIIENGQQVLLSTASTGSAITQFQLYVASVSDTGNVTWTRLP